MAPNKRIAVALIGVMAVAVAFALRAKPEPWARPLKQPPPYPRPSPETYPIVVKSEQLPQLANYSSPKPVVAADSEGNVVVVAHGVQDRPRDLVVWRSVDRGETWGLADKMTSDTTKGEFLCDPWLATDGQGQYYIVYGHAPEGRPGIRRSRDSGKTWSDPLLIPWTSCDRPVIAISPNGKRLIVASAMSEKKSTSSVRPLNGDDPDLQAKIRASVRYYSGIFVSEDHGESWKKRSGPFGDDEHAIPFSIAIDDNDRVAASWIVEGKGSKSAVSISEDQGQTWAATTLVESLRPDRPHPFNGERFPVLADDMAGSLHVAFVSSRSAGLMVRRSKDWKAWETPLQLSSADAEEVRMAAIDTCGPMVHVTWMERVGNIWHAYYRGSRDFGETWSVSCRLSTAIKRSDSSIANGFGIYGDDDQSSVSDDGLGRIHVVWSVQGGGFIHAVIEWSLVYETSQ